ncbi:MAG: DNA polymerase III subunit alpha [Acholeplasmatales bacterium]|nr:DNA polymerase III subunit alpha [Acholeplasmatales bacterium]
MKGFLYGKTEYSILASTNRLDEYISYAKSNSFDFLTITDKNMYGAYKFYKACIKNNIKPVMGLEYTYTLDLKQSKVILYAKNNEGFKSLLKITSDVNINEVDSLDYLEQYKDNLFIIFIFNDSYIEELFFSRNYERLNALLEIINSFNGYIGLSYTNKLEKTAISNDMEDYARDHDVKITFVHECKYLKTADSKVYEALRMIDGVNEKLGEFDDYSFLANPIESENVNEIVNGISLDLFNNKIALPKFPNTKGTDSETYLKALCHKGLERRGKLNRAYQERLNYELSIISKMGYNDYFLIVWDFIRYSKKNNILVGPGRGSAAGSLVAYTLGITDVDPLDYDLLFERFLNPERVSMPDIDTDFPDNERDNVINYVKEFYGEKHVSSITAFGTFQLKSSVRDLARVTNMDNARVDKISLMVEEYGFDKLIDDYKDRDSEITEFLTIAKGLEGLPKHISTHAAGIILSDIDLTDVIPLRTGINGVYQSQFEAPDLEAMGLLKMDFLGLKNLSMIKGMMDDLGNFTRANLMNIPLNDIKVYKMLQRGDTLGIFQLEKPGMRRTLTQLKPTEFNDLVAVLALYRPGPMDNIPTYIRRKHGERVEYLHPDLAPILKSTYGVIVYQEQIMQIAQKFAGFSLGEADVLRRAVSKKKADKMDELQESFIKRSVEKGYSEDIARSIYDLIYKFANYGFNKSHSVAYAVVSYEMAWFKANHFPEFMANILNDSVSDSKGTAEYIRYAKSHGLVIRKPDINISAKKYVKHNNMLYMPISTIFSIGTNVSNKILEARGDIPFKDFSDLINRCDFLSKGHIEALVYSGALDSFGKSKKSLLSDNQSSGVFSEFITKVEVMDEYPFDVLMENEKKYLGINLEYNLFSNTDSIRARYRTTPILNLQYNQRATLLCAFSKISEVRTKAKNELMLVGDLYDIDGEVRYIIFPSTLEKLPFKPITNKLYIVTGLLKKDNRDEDSFNIYEINEVK